ncbi:hypothetical protein PCCS19_36970 [Paenibacillus sp. CCS19]|uniref:SDR family NAD(P)-dependent oxidoreductase n=1 Tax=Paenibacillus sp. CCS19 TaxID=3158387 RepID=UPI0025605FA1|nr:SDR family NAD(P)-dependent oxidoreductase [Paenibacillus cellulosilyticus]GMK40641.1 hypothetical protein PCCS19_36970 [Paenibacillus cellulosilyticus]
MSKVYVITGGSGGMGKAIARRLGQQGALLLADVSEERLQAAIEVLRIAGYDQHPNGTSRSGSKREHEMAAG